MNMNNSPKESIVANGSCGSTKAKTTREESKESVREEKVETRFPPEGEGRSGLMGAVTDEAGPPLVKIQARKINCKTSDGHSVVVDWFLLQQSKQFKRVWDEHRNKKKGTNGRSRKFTFHMENVDSDTFQLVLQWLLEHDGMDDPVVKEDPATGDRVWFEFTDFERRFFDVPLHILNDLLNAGKSLDIPSLYLFGCQSMAALLQNKSPAEIRDMLGLENDLTSADLAMIRRRNRKFKMRELKAAKYATRLQQLQTQLQQMGMRQGQQGSGSVAEQLLLAGQ